MQPLLPFSAYEVTRKIFSCQIQKNLVRIISENLNFKGVDVGED